MPKTKTKTITINNLDNFKFLSKQEVKKFLKETLKVLPSYTANEENILISVATNLTPTQLVLFNGFDRKLLKKIKKYLKLRLKNMPLNKIAKSTFFYTNKFYINNYCLAPRQETELLVEKVIEYIKQNNFENTKVLDLCCGSGIIGLSVARNVENSLVTLSDVSPKALKVTKKNRKNLKLEKNSLIIKSDMFKNLKNESTFDIIVSNPPYIKTKDIENLDESVKNYDPVIALDGGEDGLKFYKDIANNAKNYLTKNGKIFLEIGFDQGQDVKTLFNSCGYSVTLHKDYSNLDRIIIAELK